MKKALLVFCLFASHYAFAGTGGAEDENMLILSFLAVIVSVLVLLYAKDCIRKRIAERKGRCAEQPPDDAHSEETDEDSERKHPESTI
jgi:hypothetical protein